MNELSEHLKETADALCRALAEQLPRVDSTAIAERARQREESGFWDESRHWPLQTHPAVFTDPVSPRGAWFGVTRCANCGLSRQQTTEAKYRVDEDIPCCDGTRSCWWCGKEHADDRPDGAPCKACVVNGLAEEEDAEHVRR